MRDRIVIFSVTHKMPDFWAFLVALKVIKEKLFIQSSQNSNWCHCLIFCRTHSLVLPWSYLIFHFIIPSWFSKVTIILKLFLCLDNENGIIVHTMNFFFLTLLAHRNIKAFRSDILSFIKIISSIIPLRNRCLAGLK